MKLLKFDTIYPTDCLNLKVIQESDRIEKMSFDEYHQWLIDLRMTYSDFYSYNLAQNGMDAEEFILNNDIYFKKCGKYYWGGTYGLRKLFHRFRNMISHVSVPFSEKIIEKHIAVKNPDILFIREQANVRSKFWERYKKTKLVVSRMDCGVPADWSPFSFDLIYSNIPSFINFFKANNLKVLQNHNGFDKRILESIKTETQKYDVTFVGGLGSYFGFVQKSNTLEELLRKYGHKFNFSWWGYKTGNFDTEYPILASHYQGQVAGLDMFRIYAQSKIVLNDYGAGVGGVGVNMRIFEVLGIGSLLLTRVSPTIDQWGNYLTTYMNENDCAEKIEYFLKNNAEREKIASAGQQYVLQNYNYEILMSKLSEQLREEYRLKFTS